MRAVHFAAAVAAASLFAMPAAAAVTFNYAFFETRTQLYTESMADPSLTDEATSTDFREAFSLQNISATQALSTEVSDSSGVLADAQLDLVTSITFSDAANGTMAFTGFGEVNSYADDFYNQIASDTTFSYAFTVDQASTITLTRSAFFGSYSLYALGGSPVSSGIFNGGGSNTFALAAGSYAFTVNPQYLLRQNGEGSVTGNINTTIDFSISNAVVPEPSTWALMIGGFGMAGAALRRKHALAA